MLREFVLGIIIPSITLIALGLSTTLWNIVFSAAAGFGLFVLFWAIGWWVNYLTPRLSVNPDRKAVFITGCDSGFGHNLAKKLDSENYQVFAGCLFPDGEGAKALKRNGSSRMCIVPIDVTKDQDFKKALEIVEDNLGCNDLWAVVANAGIYNTMEFEWFSMKEIQQMFDVNVFGVTRAILTFLPLLRRSKGRVIITSSYASRYVPHWNSVYGMTKHAVLALGDGLRRELKKWEISVVLIEPIFYKTTLLPTTDSIARKYNAIESNEIKAAYGKDYLEEMSQASQSIMLALSREDTNEVVLAMTDAVKSRNPLPIYRCDSTLIWASSTIQAMLPPIAFDFIDYIYFNRFEPQKNGTLHHVGAPIDKFLDKIPLVGRFLGSSSTLNQ